ncbi:uncharacterized protein [Drosophila takahashii]|uniref:uncharacterized protein n=1 Tax=Drosophila takahashii TaxID=29030 RepID=UPI003899117F
MPSTQVEAPKPQQPEMPPPQVESPKPQQPETLPPPQPEPPRSNPGEHHVRTDIPAAHVSHSARAFVIDGVRWRQQTITWTWPEGPAEDATAGEEPQIWEEVEPRVSPRDPRVRGRPEATATQNPGSTTPAPATPDSWKPPTPSTGPATPAPPHSGAAADNATRKDEPLERGPWVWPEPLAGQRPPWKRQHSAPEVVGEAETDAADVGTRGSAVARDREGRVARRDRRRTSGEGGPHPGRKAQRARKVGRARVPSEDGARGPEGV